MSSKSSSKPARRPRPGKSRAKRPRTPKQSRAVKAASRRKAKKAPLREIPLSLDYARRHFMVTGSVRGAATSTGVSVGQLRRLIKKYRLARWDRERRKWVRTDRMTREVGIASNGRAKTIIVRGFSRAQVAKGYTAAVKRFLETNDVAVLAPYEGQTISDVKKQQHLLETRPNVLLRLANTGSDAEMKIYRLLD